MESYLEMGHEFLVFFPAVKAFSVERIIMSLMVMHFVLQGIIIPGSNQLLFYIRKLC